MKSPSISPWAAALSRLVDVASCASSALALMPTRFDEFKRIAQADLRLRQTVMFCLPPDEIAKNLPKALQRAEQLASETLMSAVAALDHVSNEIIAGTWPPATGHSPVLKTCDVSFVVEPGLSVRFTVPDEWMPGLREALEEWAAEEAERLDVGEGDQ